MARLPAILGGIRLPRPEVRKKAKYLTEGPRDAALSRRFPRLAWAALLCPVSVAGCGAAPSVQAVRPTPIAMSTAVIGSLTVPGPDDLLTVHVDRENVHEFRSVSVDTTGIEAIAARPAMGDMQITNHLPTTLHVPAGTEVDTDSGIRFVTTNDVSADPHVHIVPVTAPSVAIATIVAVVTGPSGDVPAHTGAHLVGIDASSATVDILYGTSDGRDAGERHFVLQQDFDGAMARARDEFRPALIQSVKDHLETQPNGQTALLSTETISPTESTSVRVGDQAVNFSLDADVRGSITTVAEAELQKVLRAALARQVPAGSRLTVEPLRIEYHVATLNPDGGVTLACSVSGSMRRVV
ncbi:MAG: baseplate J/gp47 family protein [Candidatus Dormibacteria bacterium]